MLNWTIVCLLAAAIWLAPHHATATEWFVAQGGTGNGTSAAPFGRIQDAIAAAQPGDTITVGSGTFAGPLGTVRSGTAAGPIRIRAAGSRGSTVVTSAGRVLTVNHAHISVEGLVLDGQYGADDTVRVSSAGHYLQLRDLEVRRSTLDLVDMGAPQGVVIDGCLIHHALNPANGRSDAHGIVAGAVQDLTIRNTEIHTFSGDGIQIDPGRAAPGWNRVTIEGARIWLQPLPAAENGFPAGISPGENAVDTKASPNYPRASITIRDTVAFGFRDSAVMTNAAAFNLKENVDALVDRVTVHDSQIAFRTRGPGSTAAGARVTVRNAVVYNVAAAFRYEDNIERLRIANATLGASVTTPFFAASSNSAGLDIANLLVLGSLPTVAATSPGSRATTADAFVNAAGGDYRLVATAPAVDAGFAVPDVLVDRDGIVRPQGMAYDVGAYERVPATAPPPPPPPSEPPPPPSTEPPPPSPEPPPAEPPPAEPPAPREIALHAWTAAPVAGNWAMVRDTTAAGGFRLWSRDEGRTVAAASPAPQDYFELTAWVEAGVPYRLWLRGKADKNRATNDSVYVQFSGTVGTSGTPIHRIGSASGLTVTLEECDKCGLASWGWQDNGAGKNVLGPPLYFGASGPQRIRVQVREDGISIDQVVLSPAKYLHASPGAPKRDTTILPESN